MATPRRHLEWPAILPEDRQRLRLHLIAASMVIAIGGVCVILVVDAVLHAFRTGGTGASLYSAIGWLLPTSRVAIEGAAYAMGVCLFCPKWRFSASIILLLPLIAALAYMWLSYRSVFTTGRVFVSLSIRTQEVCSALILAFMLNGALVATRPRDRRLRAVTILITVVATTTLLAQVVESVLRMFVEEPRIGTDPVVEVIGGLGDLRFYATGVAAATLLGCALLEASVRQQRRERGQCLHCEYDMDSSIAPRCPECGAEREAQSPPAPDPGHLQSDAANKP